MKLSLRFRLLRAIFQFGIFSLFPGVVSSEETPRSVQIYWNAEKAVVESSPRASLPISLGFKPLFWSSAAGFREHSEAWLVSFQVALDKRMRYNVVSIVDESGRAIFSYPGSEYLQSVTGLPFKTASVSDARFITVAQGEQMLALAFQSPDPRSPGKFELYTLSPQEKTVFTDSGQADSVKGDSRTWESTYYFFDADGDGRSNALVTRIIRETSNEGAISYSNQMLLYEFTPKTLVPYDISSRYQDGLDSLFTKAKDDPSSIRIMQMGVVRVPGEDKGKSVRE